MKKASITPHAEKKLNARLTLNKSISAGDKLTVPTLLIITILISRQNAKDFDAKSKS